MHRIKRAGIDEIVDAPQNPEAVMDALLAWGFVGKISIEHGVQCLQLWIKQCGAPARDQRQNGVLR